MDGYLKAREVTGKVWSKLAEKYRFLQGKEAAFVFQKTCGQEMSLTWSQTKGALIKDCKEDIWRPKSKKYFHWKENTEIGCWNALRVFLSKSLFRLLTF